MQELKKVSRTLRENVEYLSRILPVKESFDLIQRDMYIGGRESTFYFIDGFTKDESMLKIMDSFFGVKEEEMPPDATGFARCCVPYVEVDVLADYNDILKNLLSGATCLFVDGYAATAVLTRREAWRSRIRTSRSGDPGTDLWKRLSLTQRLSAGESGIRI